MHRKIYFYDIQPSDTVHSAISSVTQHCMKRGFDLSFCEKIKVTSEIRQ